MQYNPPLDGAINDPWLDGDPTFGINGSVIGAHALEYPQRELVNVITDNGLSPTNADLHQVSRAIQQDLVNYGIDTGTANNIVVTLPVAPVAYTAGLKIFVLIKFNNTGATVINVNGLGNKPVLSPLLEELAIDNLVTNGIALIYYDGTRFQLLFGAKASSGPAGPQGLQGTAGTAGTPGTPGSAGAKGDKGDTGAAGSSTGISLIPGAIGTYAFWDIGAGGAGTPAANTPAGLWNLWHGSGWTFPGTWQLVSGYAPPLSLNIPNAPYATGTVTVLLAQRIA